MLPRDLRPVGWLALGTFAIGTESFMIAPLLPRMADDLQVSVARAGWLVTAFALAFAVGSPLLTVATARLPRRALLSSAMGAFALANLVAWAAPGFWGLLAARVLLALAAGMYTPNAIALAGTLVPETERGRAVAIVNAGTTLAIIAGLPLGAALGSAFGWRATFLFVAILAALAVLGVRRGIAADAGAAVRVAGLRQRLAVARQGNVLAGLAVTFAWAFGAYAVWTYIAPYLQAVLGWSGSAAVSGTVLLWGVAAATGVMLGGSATDRFGALRTAVPALMLLSLAYLALGWLALPGTAAGLPHGIVVVAVPVAVAAWGLGVWGFFPAQAARLIGMAGPAEAPVALSLNSSAMFAGFSAGAGLGGQMLQAAGPAALCLLGCAAEVLALLAVMASAPRCGRCAPAALARS